MLGAGKRVSRRPATPTRSLRRSILAILVIEALCLALAVPPGALPGKGGFPLPGFLKLRLVGDSSAAFLGLPQQPSGKPAGGEHQVPADATRSGGGSGRAPGKGLGAVDPYTPPTVEAKPSTTPVKTGGHSFDPATSKRIASAASATSDVYANTDGSYTRKVFHGPVNFKKPDGSWQPIDQNLVQGSDSRWRQRANGLDVTFGVSAVDASLAAVRLDAGHAVSYSLTGAATVTASASGDTATYAGVQPEVDVRLRATATGFKETLVLHSANAPTSWVFPLKLEGLTARLDTGGSVSLLDNTGAVRLMIPAGYMEDSKFNPKSGAFARSEGVTYELTTVDGGQALRVSIDEKWLRDPSRVFPVTVDPTIDYADTTGDTYVKNTSTADQSGADELLVGTWNGGVEKAYSFMKFDTFPSDYNGARVNAAELHLFDYWAYTCTPQTFWVHQITQDWQVSSPKTYPGPTMGDPVGWVAANPGAACTNTSHDRSVGTWITVPLMTGLFQDWALGRIPNYGLALSASQTDNNQWKRFTSREGPCCAGPYLQMTYTPNLPPQVDFQYPSSGYGVTTLTPELLVSAHDPDGWPNPLQYSYVIYDKGFNKIYESGWKDSPRWVLPVGTLKWGEAYTWTALVSDSSHLSESQTYNTFTTPVPQPLTTSGLSQNGGRGFDPNGGNYTSSATDAAVATIGPSLTVQRAYNSLDPRTDSAFGAGWSSFVDMKATEVAVGGSSTDSTVVIRYPTGQEIAFGKNADGTYVPPAGRFATFSRVDSGGYRLADKDGTTYTFTVAAGTGTWRISSIADAAGHTEMFTYADPAVAGVPSKITSASGRTLNLTWAAGSGATKPHVTAVTMDPLTAGNTSTALTWTYTYNGNQLTKVCPPTSSTDCTTYTYMTATRHPSTVLAAGPQSYWRLGEASGTTAVSAAVSNGGADSGTYTNVALGQPGPLPGSTATAAGFNGTSSYLALPASAVPRTNPTSISLWFKMPAGSTAGGVLYSYQASDAGLNPPSDWVPALYVGTDGLLRGQFWTGDVNRAITSSVTVNNGNWHHAVLSAGGGSQSLYLDGALVGAPLNAGRIDTSAQNAYIGAGKWALWPGNTAKTDVGWFNGSISDVAIVAQQLPAETVTQMYAAGTSGASLLNSVTRPSGGTSAQVAYDPVSGRVSQVTDANGGAWKVSAPVASGSSQVYVGSVLSGRPADYWRLAEKGTIDAVNQVNGNTATYSSVSQGNDGGPFDDAKVPTFNGTTSYLKMPAADVPHTSATSISMWFKMPAGSAAGGVLFSYQANDVAGDPWAPGDWVPALYVGTNGRLHGHFWIGDMSKIMTSAPVNDGNWHHVALAASGNSQSLYLDGARIAGPVAGNRVDTNAQYVNVGAGKWHSWPDTTGPVGRFAGQIAEVAFYKSQLTDPDVAAQFAARAKSAGTPIKTVTVTDPGNRNLSYVYDAQTGRQVAETDALGNKTQYGYDAGGFLRTVTDPNGNLTTTEHDVRGNTVSQTTCQNQAANKCSTVYYTYYPDATTRTLTPHPKNDVLLTVRDGRSANADDNTYRTTYDYDNNGNRTTVTDPLGRVTNTTYTNGTTDAGADGGFAPAGLPATLTTPGGARQTVVYYKSGDVATVTDPAGKVTTFTYDGLGRVLTKTETTDTFPSGLTTRYSFDGQGRITERKDPQLTNRVTGALHTLITTAVYDVDGLTTSQTVSDTTGGDASRTVSSTYNAHGQAVTTTDAAGNTVRLEYDAYGNVTKETDADGGVTTSTYDAEGRLLTSTLNGYTGDPNNPSPASNLLVTSKAYDPAGRLASVTDAMGWITAHTYTDNGLAAKITRTDPATGAIFVQEDNSYDPAGNLTTRVTNNGATTTSYTVDAASRNTSATLDPAGLKRTTAYTLSADDTAVVTQISDASGTIARTEATYDPLGRITSQTTFNDVSGTPAGWWKLNEKAGTVAADSSGNSRTASLTSAVAWADDAAVFNGNGSAVTTSGPVLDTTKSFTVSAWVKANELTTTWGGIVGQDAGQNSGFYLQYRPDTKVWEFAMVASDAANPPSARVASQTPVSVGAWTHLIAVFDASAASMSLYVNGTKEATASNATPIASSGPLALGRTKFMGVTADYQFKGAISNVQAYPRAVPDAEASTLFANGRGGAALSTNRLTTRWTVDKGGLARSMTDPNGNTTNYDYDEAGRAVVTAAPAVATEAGDGGAPITVRPVSYVGYNTFGEQVETKDPKGNVTIAEYDAAGRVVTSRLPAYTPPGSATPINPVATRTYDTLGQMLTSTDPLGKKTSYVYDQLGHVAKVTAPNLGETKFTYDLLGDQLSMTDPTGAVRTATYDYLGRRRTSSEVVRQDNTNYTTEYTYGTGGWLASVKSPTGVLASTIYNAAGQPVTVTDGATNITTKAYDGAGRPVRTTLPDGTYSTASYDMAGRTTATASYNAAGTLLARQSSAYDANGNPTAVTDARGTTRTLTYDATGLLTAQVEPISASDAITTTFGYDTAGNQTRFTDGRGNHFLATYNTWNLPESRVEPATTAYPNPADRTFTTVYDAAGRMASQTLPGGVSVTNTYDDMGNPTKQVGAGAEVATTDRTFGYDLAGRITSASGAAGAVTIAYDDRGLPRSVGGVAGSSSFTYTPDAEMASRADAAGTTNYTYDTAGRLATTSNPANGVQMSYGYNNLSQLSGITYGTNGNTRSFSYDSLHRLTVDEVKTPTAATIAKIAYGYDTNGNETSKTTTGFAGTTTNTYTYDLADRLTTWNNGPTTTAYAYDKSGNRTQVGSRTFSYDQRNQLTGSSDGTTYEHTARGTLKATHTTAATMNTQADAFGQIISQDAGTRQTYTYDAFGRLIRSGFAYAGLGNRLASDGTATYTRDPSGDLVGVASSTAKTLVFNDQHDDVVGQFTDTATALTGTTTYDPFGKILATSSMLGSLGYQSEWTDSTTGRVNMLARWYNPDTGQFDTRDTVGNSPVPDSVNANRFAYANANPLLNTDPTGHWAVWDKFKSGVSRGAKIITSTASASWNSFTSTVSSGWNSFTSTLSAGYHAATTWAEQKIDQGLQWAEKKVDQGRKWVAQKAQQVKQVAKKAVSTVKQVGRTVVAKTTRVVNQTINTVKDGYNAAEKWVKEHKDILIEIAAIAGGVLAGLACTAATVGAGAVACMVGAAALINLAKDSAQGNIHNWGDAFGSVGTGALQGLAGGVGGIVGGKVAAFTAGKLGGFAGSMAGRMLSGGIAGGVGDAATQYVTTGEVDMGGVVMGAGIGAVTGGFAKGGARGGGARAPAAESSGARGGGTRANEPAPARRSADENVGTSCKTHSFDPNTPVVMADGSTKPIKDVKVEDKVAATDPKTGATDAKPVTALHLNHDTDLTDVTVAVGAGEKSGKTTVLHTTQHHPFWDQTAGKWAYAADLVVGHQLHSQSGDTATVVGVRNYTDGQNMHDLTVDDTHTYYVMAGDTPVLVHNDNGGLGDNINLYGDYTARMDQFNVRGQASFEVHVYHRGSELGIYGSNGFFNKHGINAGDVSVPDQVNNRLKGIAVDQMRKLGQLGPNENIKGDAWKRPMIGTGGGC